MRYAGSLLKYSLSEADYDKSAPLVTLGPKGEEPGIELVPLTPPHDLRRIRGPLAKLVSADVVSAADAQDYLHVILTDQNPQVNAMARLRDAYPNVMSIEYDNARTRAAGAQADGPTDEPREDPLQLFSQFYEAQNGTAPTERQLAIVEEELEGIGVM